MRQFSLFILLFIPHLFFGQSFTTAEFELIGIEEVEVHLDAPIEIECSGKELLRIEASQPMQEQIEVHIRNNRLILSARGNIRKEQILAIKLNAPNLRFIQVNAATDIEVKQIQREEFSAMALNGNIQLSGQTPLLNANGELGSIDARQLDVKEVKFNLWGETRVYLASPEKVRGKTHKSAKVFYEKEPLAKLDTYKDAELRSSKERGHSGKVRNPDARFIKFAIKNNSLKRIQCYVKGPKPDGSSFSYGFPMNPGQMRDKDWSVGSRVYQVNKMGLKKLLVEIKADDEGQMVKMFE
ncbi:MAG: DUF2807 domain-containing protein [Bacteroidia bacterium]|nr:DUF2807 domain-containing protein [Bacteroidia bacterium]